MVNSTSHYTKHSRLVFIGTEADREHLYHLKSCIGVASCAPVILPPGMQIQSYYELIHICKTKQATAIVTTSRDLLGMLVGKMTSETMSTKPSIDNYAGSIFKVPGSTIEVLIINPLEQFRTVNYNKFLTTRYLSKLVDPDSWLAPIQFNWSIYSEAEWPALYARFQNAEALAFDIETFQSPPSIRCVGFTALFYSPAGWTTESVVIPCTDTYKLACIRQLCALPIPKIAQNGKYDIAYLQAYDSAPAYYLWDTIEMYHSWYSELPKDLASLNSFFVRDSMYWKDLATTHDLTQYYLYNAKDHHNTAVIFLSWMLQAPQWAKNNYANTFPLQFPCHLAEMTGLARDEQEMELARVDLIASITTKTARLAKMVGVPGFNSNSHLQVKKLLIALGCGDITSTEEPDLKRAALRHPLNNLLINLILDIRGDRKLKSTYLRTDEDITTQNKKGGKEFYGHLNQYRGSKRGRILFALNPHGTDSGRLASTEHHFWCGLQAQNIPRGPAVKRTIIADNGFRIAEADLKQAESRDTAYIAGDENLIKAVSSTKDFHSLNANAFFGVPYNSIFDDSTGKTLNKDLRDLSKKTNHGASYNMGPDVMVRTMGEDKVAHARKILGLPKLWTLRKVTEHLLGVFHRTYKTLQSVYYVGVSHEVVTTKMLASTAVHDAPYQAVKSGHVRYCFGRPDKNKTDLNSYVAHPPQSLNAMTLNRGYMRVFYEISLHPEHGKNFKLGPQIHDSILFQFRIGHAELAETVKRCMEIPVTLKGYDGKTRTFTVPADIKAGSDNNGAERWSQTE